MTDINKSSNNRFHSLESVDKQHFDYVIIGAGSSGTVIASRLAEMNPNIRVCLLEAGNHATEPEAKIPLACPKLQQTQRDWMYRTEPSTKSMLGYKNQVCNWAAGKCLGGSSVLNYMGYVRGCEQDYNVWERKFGATGWSWKDVFPLFRRAECNETLVNKKKVDCLVLDPNCHGTKGPLKVSSNPTPSPIPYALVKGLTEEMGFKEGDYNSGQSENVASIFQQTITARGRRADVATCYLLPPERQFPNLTIVVDAQATKLLLKQEKAGHQKVVGAEFVDAKTNESHTVFSDGEVIVSCGAVGSPRLLLLSGIGPKKELQELGIECLVDSPHVGKHLSDHLLGLLPLYSTKDIQATNNDRAEAFPWAIPRILNWLFFGKGPFATSAYDATAFFKTEEFKSSHPDYGPDGQFAILSTPGNVELFQRNVGTLPEMDFLEEHYSKPDPQGALIVMHLLHPHSKGTVQLRSKDPLELPKITSNYFEDERDLDRMVFLMKEAVKLTETSAMKKVFTRVVHSEKLLKEHGGQCTDAYWKQSCRLYCNTVYHPVGTCGIGRVVDPTLKFMGNKISGVRIADASIFPTHVSGNTNAPCIMVGEKCAEMIAKENNWSYTLLQDMKKMEDESSSKQKHIMIIMVVLLALGTLLLFVSPGLFLQGGEQTSQDL